MALTLILNGQTREFAGLSAPASLAQVVDQLALKADRIAVEHNGTIAGRTRWNEVAVQDGDRLEVVHFVGGGSTAGEDRGPGTSKSGSFILVQPNLGA